MNKKLLIIFGIIFCILLISFSYLSIYGIQTVSTDKNIYYNYPRLENQVKITYSNFDIFSNSCNSIPLIIYKQEGDVWVEVNYELNNNYFNKNNRGCLEGKMLYPPFLCDVILFKFLNYDFGQFIWDTNFYEAQGTINQCGNISGTYTNYVLKKAPEGKYKVVYGGAEEEFVLTSEMRGI